MTDSSPSAEPSGRSLWREVAAFAFLSFGYVGMQFVLTPVRIRLLTSLLTKEQYGVLNLAIMTISFLATVVSLGSFEYLLRKLPGKSETYQYALFSFCIRYFGGMSILLVAIFGGFVFLSGMSFHLLSATDLLACGLGLVLFSHLLQRVYFLLGRSELLKFRAMQFLYSDLWFVPIVVIASFWVLSVGAVVWIWALWLLLVAVLTTPWISMRRMWPARHPDVGLKPILLFSVPLLPAIFSEWMFRLGDRYLILAFLDIETVANYTLVMNIAMIAFMIGQNVIGVILPRFNALKDQHTEDTRQHPWESRELRHLFTIMLRYAWVCSVVATVILATMGRSVLAVLAAPKFGDAAYLFPWAAPASIFFLSHSVFSKGLIVMDRSVWVGGLTVTGAVLNLLLNCILIPLLGARGAALATCISLFVMALAAGYAVKAWRWVLWNELRLGRMLVLFVLCILGAMGVNHYSPLGSLLNLILAGLWSVILTLGLGVLHRKEIPLLFKR